MLSAPQIIQTTAQTAAVIHLTAPRREMMAVFGPAVGELMGVLAAQGVEPVGAVFAHHIKMSPEIFDFELGVKVSAPVKATGRVKPGELPASKGGAHRLQRYQLVQLRCGKTNCWKCSKLSLVGIRCHFWLFVISTLEAIGILPASVDITTNAVITTACHRSC